MRFVAILLSLVASGSFADESWFVGNWTWSRERSIEIWSQGNPVARTQLIEVAPKVTENWKVDSGTLEITIDGVSPEPVNYFIRPIDDSQFELMLDLPDGKVHYKIIRHTEFGFCYRRGGNYSDDPAPREQETCFVPAGE